LEFDQVDEVLLDSELLKDCVNFLIAKEFFGILRENGPLTADVVSIAELNFFMDDQLLALLADEYLLVDFFAGNSAEKVFLICSGL
jgi:hypothetical protein